MSLDSSSIIEKVKALSATTHNKVKSFISAEIISVGAGKDADESERDINAYILSVLYASSKTVLAKTQEKNALIGYGDDPEVDYEDREINGETLSSRVAYYVGTIMLAVKASDNLSLGLGILNTTSAIKVLTENRRWAREPINPIKNIKRNISGELFYTMREADHSAWVKGGAKGILITLVTPRVEDMCDYLNGLYPIDFVFYGWHPSCRCIATPVKYSVSGFPEKALIRYNEKRSVYKNLSSFKLNKKLWTAGVEKLKI